MPADSYENMVALDEVPLSEALGTTEDEIDIEEIIAMEADADAAIALRYARVQSLTIDFILNAL